MNYSFSRVLGGARNVLDIDRDVIVATFANGDEGRFAFDCFVAGVSSKGGRVFDHDKSEYLCGSLADLLAEHLVARHDYSNEASRADAVRAAEAECKLMRQSNPTERFQWRHIEDAKGTAYVVERLG
jgi:hypothetical protein